MSHLAKLFHAALIVTALASLARAELKVGAAFPTPIVTELATSEKPELAGKILVVDFWASWCAPCKASFPALGKVARDYAARGVVLLGVSVDESPGAYAAFVKKFSPPFRTLHDARQNLARAVQVPAMPTTYVVDRQGKVRAIHTGFHGEASDRKLRADLDALVAAKD
jgi:thiol-disulfide isomerase/thioredoxin